MPSNKVRSFWECDYCGLSFDSEEIANDHEKTHVAIDKLSISTEKGSCSYNKHEVAFDGSAEWPLTITVVSDNESAIYRLYRTPQKREKKDEQKDTGQPYNVVRW